MQVRTGVGYLLYDASCGPCTRFKNIIMNLNPRHNVIAVPLQLDFARELVRGRMKEEDMMRSMHLVYFHSTSPLDEKEKRVLSGGDALVELVRLLPSGSILYRLVKRSRFLRKSFGRFYTIMTGLRSKSKSCKHLN